MSLTEVNPAPAPDPIPSSTPVQQAADTTSDASVMSNSESTKGSEDMSYEEKCEAAKEQAKLEEDARKAEEEAARKAEEEAARKAEEEARRKAEAEAKKQAELEAKQKAQEKAQLEEQKAEAERLKKEEENKSLWDKTKEKFKEVGEKISDFIFPSDDDSFEDIDEADIKEAQEKLEDADEKEKAEKAEKEKTEAEASKTSKKDDKNTKESEDKKADKKKDSKTDKKKDDSSLGSHLKTIFGIDDDDSFLEATLKCIDGLTHPRTLLANEASRVAESLSDNSTVGKVVKTALDPVGTIKETATDYAVEKVAEVVEEKVEKEAKEEAFREYTDAQSEYDEALAEYNKNKNEDNQDNLAKAQEALQSAAEAHIATKGEPVKKELQDSVFQVCTYEDGSEATFIKQPDGSWKLDASSYSPIELQREIESHNEDTAFTYMGNTYYSADGKYYSLDSKGVQVTISKESFDMLAEQYNSSFGVSEDDKVEIDGATDTDGTNNKAKELQEKLDGVVEKHFSELSDKNQEIFIEILEGKEVDISELSGSEVSELLESLRYAKTFLSSDDWKGDVVFANGQKQAVEMLVDKLTDAYAAGEINNREFNKNLAQIKFVMDKTGYVPSDAKIKNLVAEKIGNDVDFKLYDVYSGVYQVKEESIAQKNAKEQNDSKQNTKIEKFDDIRKAYASKGMTDSEKETALALLENAISNFSPETEKLFYEGLKNGFDNNTLKNLPNDQAAQFAYIVEKLNAEGIISSGFSNEQIGIMLEKIAAEYNKNSSVENKGAIRSFFGKIAEAEGKDSAAKWAEKFGSQIKDKSFAKDITESLTTQDAEDKAISNTKKETLDGVSKGIEKGKAAGKIAQIGSKINAAYSNKKAGNINYKTSGKVSLLDKLKTTTNLKKASNDAANKIASATKDINKTEAKQYSSSQNYINTKGSVESSSSSAKRSTSQLTSSLTNNIKNTKAIVGKVNAKIVKADTKKAEVKSGKDLKDLQNSKQEIENNIDSNNEIKESIENGTNEIIKDATDNYEDSKEAYMKALNVSSNPEIQELQKNINSIGSMISDGRTQISNYDKGIINIQSQISNTTKQISNLTSSINDYRKELQALEASNASASEIAEMKSIISSLKTQRAEAQKEKEVFENEKRKLNSEKNVLEETVRQYQRMQIDAEAELKQLKSDIYNAAYSNMKVSKNALEEVKSDLLKQADSQIQKSKNELLNVNDDINDIEDVLNESNSKTVGSEIHSAKQEQSNTIRKNNAKKDTMIRAEHSQNTESYFDNDKNVSKYNESYKILSQTDDKAAGSISDAESDMKNQQLNIDKIDSKVSDSYDEIDALASNIRDLGVESSVISNELAEIENKLSNPYSMSKDQVEKLVREKRQKEQEMFELIQEQEEYIQKQSEILEDIEYQKMQREKLEEDNNDSYFEILQNSALAYEYMRSIKNRKKQDKE